MSTILRMMLRREVLASPTIVRASVRVAVTVSNVPGAAPEVISRGAGTWHHRLLSAAWLWLQWVSHPSLEPSPARDQQVGLDMHISSGDWMMTAAIAANSPELLMVPFLFLVVGVFMIGSAPTRPGRFRGIRGAMCILIAIGFVTQTWWLLFVALLILAAFNVYVYA